MNPGISQCRLAAEGEGGPASQALPPPPVCPSVPAQKNVAGGGRAVPRPPRRRPDWVRQHGARNEGGRPGPWESGVQGPLGPGAARCVGAPARRGRGAGPAALPSRPSLTACQRTGASRVRQGPRWPTWASLEGGWRGPGSPPACHRPGSPPARHHASGGQVGQRAGAAGAGHPSPPIHPSIPPTHSQTGIVAPPAPTLRPPPPPPPGEWGALSEHAKRSVHSRPQLDHAAQHHIHRGQDI